MTLYRTGEGTNATECVQTELAYTPCRLFRNAEWHFKVSGHLLSHSRWQKNKSGPPLDKRRISGHEDVFCLEAVLDKYHYIRFITRTLLRLLRRVSCKNSHFCFYGTGQEKPWSMRVFESECEGVGRKETAGGSHLRERKKWTNPVWGDSRFKCLWSPLGYSVCKVVVFENMLSSLSCYFFFIFSLRNIRVFLNIFL